MTHTLTPLVDRSDAAKLLGISERTLWDLTKKREITHVKIGQRVKYAPEDLQKFIDRNRRGG